MASLLNALIGEYRVTDLLGAGGMGEVYRATHTHLGRVIAVKVLSGSEITPDTLRRFYSEASIQASLRHPGVAEYLGFYEYQGRPCILMEYVDGDTLSHILERRGPLPVEEVVHIARSLAAVVAHFHEQGVLHRDIKSGNIKITSDGTVKLLDFGIARFKSANNLTRTGMVVGTPGILAPEQVKGEAVTAATDIWQLGVLMYEMLTAQMPFDADNTPELYAKILNAAFTRISTLQPSVPPALEKIVNRCLQKDPNRRFASGGDLLAALALPAEAVQKRSATIPARAARPWPSSKLSLRQVGLGLAGVVVLVIAGIGIPRALRAFHSSSDTSQTSAPCVDPSSLTDNPSREIRTVTVDVQEGQADVICGGRRVGETPYPVSTKIGGRVNLVLQQAGFKDLKKDFIVTENHVYREQMDRIGGH